MSSSVEAKAGYAVNDCRVIVRRGPKTSYKIVQMLKVGEKMEILTASPDSGWDKVRTKTGSEGWVLHRFLSTTPPAAIQLDEIKEAHQKAEAERDALRGEVTALRERAHSQEQLKTELARVRMVSQNALDLERQNENLSQKVRHMQKEMTRLSDDNRLLERQSDTSFFLAGAAVLVVGVISGSIFTRRQRNTPFGSLE